MAKTLLTEDFKDLDIPDDLSGMDLEFDDLDIPVEQE